MGMFRPTRPPFPPPEPEIIYVPGPQGPQGPQGDKGDKGDTGPMGPKGEQGIQGIKGDTGERGPIGPSGERGDVGEKGAKGQKGDKGDKGETGPQGIQGPKGDKGDTGDRGPRGYVGPQGQDGADGADGAKGEKGDKGDRGERGYTGQQGPKGDTGERGPIGIQGQRGPKGDTGNIGPQGPKGDKGEKGDKGDPGSGSDTNAVHYTTDTGKTSSEKEQARANIGAQEAISATGFLSRDALGNISGVESQAITSYETLPVSMGGTGSNTADGARQSIGAVKEPLSEGTNGQFLSTDGNGGRIWKTVDLSPYRTSAAQDVIDATKQDTLISSGATVGQFARITSVDANGKPTGWEPVSDNAVHYTTDTGKTDAEKAIARANIGVLGFELLEEITIQEDISMYMLNMRSYRNSEYRAFKIITKGQLHTESFRQRIYASRIGGYSNIFYEDGNTNVSVSTNYTSCVDMFTAPWSDAVAYDYASFIVTSLNELTNAYTSRVGARVVMQYYGDIMYYFPFKQGHKIYLYGNKLGGAV